MLDNRVALLCAQLSKEVYEGFDEIVFDSLPGSKSTLIESQDRGQTDTQAAVLYVPNPPALYLVFRGTEKGIDWINNLQVRQKIYPYGDDSTTDVRFHQGFMNAYFAVRDPLLDLVKTFPQVPVIATGHSLGGAIATIAALDVQYNITQHTGQSIAVYSFGAPRVGNSALVNSFRRRVPQSYRFIYGWDIVTRVPQSWQGYAHVPEPQQLGSRWSWKILSRRFTDHRINNYIAALEGRVNS
ncbi:MAG: lipase family protein [Cyanobacteria bacterium P01_D01_bin.71]